MLKIKYSIIFISLIYFILSGCATDNKEDLFPELAICDTTNVSYNDDILPVLINNCYVCHSSESDQSGLLLDSHQSFSVVANNGKLLSALKHEEGSPPMPLMASKLDQCTIDKIEAWIKDGAENN